MESRVASEPLNQITIAGKTLIAGTAASTAGGFWTFLGTHHQEIGALCAMIGALCAVCGLLATLYRISRSR